MRIARSLSIAANANLDPSPHLVSVFYGPPADCGQDKEYQWMIVTSLENVARTPEPRPEAPMDRTTQKVRERLDGEAQKREAKTMRLRATRLEREASAPVEVSASKTKAVHKAPRAKAKL